MFLIFPSYIFFLGAGSHKSVIYKAFCFRYREILGAALQNQLRKKCLYKQSVLVATLNPTFPPLATTHHIFEPMQLSSDDDDDDDDDVCIYILTTEQIQCLHLTMNTRRMSANSSGRTCPHIVSGHRPKWSSEGFIMNNSRKPLIARPPQSHSPPFYSN